VQQYSTIPAARCPCREALGAVRDFASAVEAQPLPQLPRDLPPPHPVWGSVPQPKSNAARQALLVMLLSAGAGGGGMGGARQGQHAVQPGAAWPQAFVVW